MAITDKQTPPWKKKLIAIALVGVLVLSAIAFSGWYALAKRGPLASFETAEQHFKYASIGTEPVQSIPYWIWVVLPRLFPEKLPGSGGYTALGLTWEEGNEMPVGLTKESIGINRVGMNCAVCHTGTVRETPMSPPIIIPGAPSTKFDLERYNQFFFDCANDPRFTPGFIQPEIEYNHHLSFIEGQFYRYLIIPRTRKALLKQQKAFLRRSDRPSPGSGRADLTPLKVDVLGLPDDGSVGSTDIVAIWNQANHDGFAYHSDGLNLSLRETVLSGALSTGTTPKEINLDSLNTVESYLQNLQPLAYPFNMDHTQVAKGKPIFDKNCASCHALNSEKVGKVIPLNEIGTDPNRLEHWTENAANGMNQFAEKYPWDFDAFRKTNGYISPALDGIWARAPYLHNGSVPTLTDLLNESSDRPATFYRGYDVYDQEKIGFISQGEAAQASGDRFDSSVFGNSNQGHPFGANLDQSDKDALVEYLKTL